MTDRASTPTGVHAFVPGHLMAPSDRLQHLPFGATASQATGIAPVAPRQLAIAGGVKKPPTSKQRAQNFHRPIKCPICSKGFKSMGQLNQHVLYVHKKHRPFACGNLKMKPYECRFPGCRSKFDQKSHFNRHVRNLRHPQGN